ncbi:MAG: LytTR family DNA-binding domain-containing protein [Niameybacter sp.]|uniref:LytR/AlgR family response regulator transcription factor n=1 Tax=Niameybacter sp. TaxID=2033640 RepID=UPI002FC7B229
MNIAILEPHSKCEGSAKHFIRQYCQTQSIPLTLQTFNHPHLFFECFSRHTFSYIFLDIDFVNMPNLEIAEHIRKLDPTVNLILMSRSADYAIQGYRVQACYYLLKPFTYANIQTALDLCSRQNISQKPSVAITINRISQRIFLDDILYVDTMHNGIQIHRFSETLKTYMSFKTFLNLVQDERCFLQCYRGILVNMDYVKALQNDSFLLKNEEVVPIRLQDRCNLRERYHTYVFTEGLKSKQATY